MMSAAVVPERSLLLLLLIHLLHLLPPLPPPRPPRRPPPPHPPSPPPCLNQQSRRFNPRCRYNSSILLFLRCFFFIFFFNGLFATQPSRTPNNSFNSGSADTPRVDGNDGGKNKARHPPLYTFRCPDCYCVAFEVDEESNVYILDGMIDRTDESVVALLTTSEYQPQKHIFAAFAINDFDDDLPKFYTVDDERKDY